MRSELLANARALVRVAHRDPEHIPERIALFAAERQSKDAREWADRAREANPETSRFDLAERLRGRSAHVARIDGAVAGTPFFIALVPGYVAYLQQEARLTLRVAALYDHDPGSLRTTAEMLVLRGVHPRPEAAEAALLEVRGRPLPEKPAHRRPLRTWWHSVYLLLVFGGFLGAPDNDAEAGAERHPWLRAIGGMTIGGLVWLTTWVFPVTFMIAMAWGCESHARELGRRALVLYDGEAASAREAIELADRRQDAGHGLRDLARVAALAASVAIPIAFVAYADSVKQTTGVNWLGALGALVALSVVIAVGVLASRD
ncbi:MAG TPA: hypothetical protein VMT37_07565 [Solirubrobacterales bacterium]|nr:hypothetical protein [Solirubrobacterales bacterium]